MTPDFFAIGNCILVVVVLAAYSKCPRDRSVRLSRFRWHVEQILFMFIFSMRHMMNVIVSSVAQSEGLLVTF